MASTSRFKSPQLTQQQADQMLANVFDICNVAPNTIPLETLESYSSYRVEKFKFLRMLIALIMVAFLLVPFLFVAPEVTATNMAEGSSNPKYLVSVHSLFPVTSVTASIDGNNIPVFEIEENKFVIEPLAKGNMTIEATSMNKQIYRLTVDTTQ